MTIWEFGSAESSSVAAGTKLLLDLGAMLPPTPQVFFFFFKLEYIYNILFLAICFNKIAHCPLNNIIDIFKAIKKH